MPDNQIFVDTNILVYAHDHDAGEKHQVAKRKVVDLWDRPMAPAISVQVLQELYVNLIRKEVLPTDAHQTIIDYCAWYVVDNDTTLLLEGIRLRDKWQTSFWDALILAAAERVRASVIWSEDFNTGQSYDGIEVINPLV